MTAGRSSCSRTQAPSDDGLAEAGRHALPTNPSAVTTNEAIDRFLEHGGLSPASQRAYGSDLRSFAAWLDRRGLTLDEVDARVLSDWVAELGSGRDRLGAPTIARRLSA